VNSAQFLEAPTRARTRALRISDRSEISASTLVRACSQYACKSLWLIELIEAHARAHARRQGEFFEFF